MKQRKVLYMLEQREISKYGFSMGIIIYIKCDQYCDKKGGARRLTESEIRA